MTQYYSAGELTLWNPSNGVSHVFLGQVRLFEQELGTASGLGEMFADECQVDVDEFGTFAQALLDYWGSSDHPVLHTLIDGFVSTVLALAQRAGVEVGAARSDGNRHDVQIGGGVRPVSATEGALRQRADGLLQFMAR